MPGFRARRREQQIAFFFGMACLALCACTDGRSTPLVLPDGGEAGSSGTGMSAAGHSGTSALDANVDDDDDDEPNQTSMCRSIDSMWPVSAAYEEAKMVDELNALRANPTRFCQPPFVAPLPLEADAALQCAARMRARDEGSTKTGSGPDYFTNLYVDQRSPEQSYARDRARSAASARIDSEIVFFNSSTAAGVIDALTSRPDKAGDFCAVATNAWFPLVGVARYGSVWVLSFSSGRPVTRPPASGMGPSGPGNSGTAGR